jgi:hypothetical protein
MRIVLLATAVLVSLVSMNVLAAEYPNGERLEIDGVQAHVTVEVGDRFTVNITGEQEVVDTISVTEDRGTVRVEHNGTSLTCGNVQSHSSGSTTIITGGTGVVINSKGSVIIMGSSNDCFAEVHITVPQGTDIESDRIHGNLTIGDTEGALNVSSSGSSRVVVGHVSTTAIDISGSGNMQIGSVTGELEIEVSGSADVDVEDGQITELEIDAFGSAEISVFGTIRDADIEISGSGEITISTPTGDLKQRSWGSAQIQLR